MQPILEIHDLSKYYDGLAVLDHINLKIMPGEIVGLIGPNGSGKTTLMNCINGLIKVDSGHIFFSGQEITGIKTHQSTRMGIARTFQIVRIYRQLSVIENLMLSHQWKGYRFLDQLKRTPTHFNAEAMEILRYLRIDHQSRYPASHLSFGQQRLLEFAMTLMPNPELFLLDEATSGVNYSIIKLIKERIRSLNNKKGKTFILIEHNLHLINDLCQRIIVLNQGKVVATGTPQDILKNKIVKSVFFTFNTLKK